MTKVEDYPNLLLIEHDWEANLEEEEEEGLINLMYSQEYELGEIEYESLQDLPNLEGLTQDFLTKMETIYDDHF